jgi:hypothetical protein
MSLPGSVVNLQRDMRLSESIRFLSLSVRETGLPLVLTSVDDIDTCAAAVHPTDVERLFRRTAAMVVVLTLGASGWAECAGWQATPEARMVCCSSGDCPMHGSTTPGSGSASVSAQAQADSCCAASEAGDSTPPVGAFSLSPSAALLSSTLATLAPLMAPRAPFGAWRTHLPLPVGQVPKHVLLSVFLI